MPVPDTSAAIAPGRVLAGRYDLVARLARGGMAEVWEATDRVLSRSVAIKVLAPHLADDKVFVERFRREAVAAARLTSPSIVATYDTGIDAGTAYIVMELVRGRTLRQLVSGSGPLDPQLAVGVAMQIADALADAHRAGIVHRDIKPANVLICEDDAGGLRVKVTDFGIAKARAGTGLDLTQTGMVLGTPKYLSPEQIEGRTDVDVRSDLYSLGVVLYEMLTGTVPFKGDTDMATAMAHLRDDIPRLTDRRPEVEPAVEALVCSLLAKSPADRPPTAVATRQALEVILRRLSAPPLPSRRPATALGPADGTRVAPAASPGARRSPPVPTPAPGTSKLARRPGRLAGMIVGAVVIAAVIVAGLLLSSGAHPRAGITAGGPAPLHDERILSATVYLDVTGHTLDNPGQAGNAIDGNPHSVWSTVRYGSPAFGGLYAGEGLALHLSGSAHLTSLTVDSPMAGWNATAYVTDHPVAEFASLAGWGSPAGSVTGAGATTTIALDGRTGSWVLLWLTRLGSEDQASLSAITIRGS